LALVTTLTTRDPESLASATLTLPPKDHQVEDQAPSRAPTPAEPLDSAQQEMLRLLESHLDTLDPALLRAVTASEVLPAEVVVKLQHPVHQVAIVPQGDQAGVAAFQVDPVVSSALQVAQDLLLVDTVLHYHHLEPLRAIALLHPHPTAILLLAALALSLVQGVVHQAFQAHQTTMEHPLESLVQLEVTLLPPMVLQMATAPPALFQATFLAVLVTSTAMVVAFRAAAAPLITMEHPVGISVPQTAMAHLAVFQVIQTAMVLLVLETLHLEATPPLVAVELDLLDLDTLARDRWMISEDSLKNMCF